MEFRDRVDKLSEKYKVHSNQLYDYMIWNLGFKLAINHPLIWMFDRGEFRNLEYHKAEEQLRNGYLIQNGRKLEKIVNQETQKYRRA